MAGVLPQVPAPAPTDAGALRAVLDSVFASPAYRWADDPRPWRLWREWWRRLGEWLEGLRVGDPVLFRIFVAALLVALGLILLHAGWVAWRALRGAGEPPDGEAGSRAGEVRDAAWYRRAADRAAAAGRLPEALQLAFVALALALDGQGLLRYDPSMTPAECARAARLAGPDRERLGALVRALYAYAFGGRSCGADEYERWRAAGDLPWHAAAN